jgi:hypothetical protein
MHALGEGVEKNLETARTLKGIADRLRAAQETTKARSECDAPPEAAKEAGAQDCGKTSCKCKVQE